MRLDLDGVAIKIAPGLPYSCFDSNNSSDDINLLSLYHFKYIDVYHSCAVVFRPRDDKTRE